MPIKSKRSRYPRSGYGVYHCEAFRFSLNILAGLLMTQFGGSLVWKEISSPHITRCPSSSALAPNIIDGGGQRLFFLLLGFLLFTFSEGRGSVTLFCVFGNPAGIELKKIESCTFQKWQPSKSKRGHVVSRDIDKMGIL